MSDGFTVQASRKVETDAADARSVGLKAHIFSSAARRLARHPRVRGRRGRADALHGPRDGVRMHQTQAKV